MVRARAMRIASRINFMTTIMTRACGAARGALSMRIASRINFMATNAFDRFTI